MPLGAGLGVGRPGAVGEQRSRNRTNFLAGWLLTLGVSVFLWGPYDPLGVFRPWPEGQPDNIAFVETVLAAAVAIGSYVIFARPYVVLRGHSMTVRNPLRQISFPYSAITSAQGLRRYPRLTLQDGARVTVFAWEMSLYALIRAGHGGEALSRLWEDGKLYQGRHHSHLSEPGSEDRALVMSSRWRVVDPTLAVLTALWLAYLFAGVLKATR